MADGEWIDPPAPDPDMVTASRRHLTSEYASGVERLFWELEAGAFDAAFAGGLSPESLAAVLGLPSADDALHRGEYLRARRELARLSAQPQPDARPGTRSAASGEAAEAAARRAHRAGSRAAGAARRSGELRGSRPQAANPQRAAAHASTAKARASDAAERVATGLLRAAGALDQCAAR